MRSSSAVLDFRAAVARPHAVRRAVRLAFVCLALLAVSPARAWDDTKVGWRLSVLDDVTVGAGSVLVSARYGGGWGVRGGAWVRDVHVQPSAPNFYVGGNYVWSFSNLRLGAGILWIDQEN